MSPPTDARELMWTVADVLSLMSIATRNGRRAPPAVVSDAHVDGESRQSFSCHRCRLNVRRAQRWSDALTSMVVAESLSLMLKSPPA